MSGLATRDSPAWPVWRRAWSGLTAAADEDFPFKNNVPDPLLSGKELPTFKFELEKSQGRVIEGSYGKEVTASSSYRLQGIARPG